MTATVHYDGPLMSCHAAYTTEGLTPARGAAVFVPHPTPDEVFGGHESVPSGLRTLLDGLATMTWDDVTDKLIDLRCLKEDWDGLGSAKPAPQALRVGYILKQEFLRHDVRCPDRVLASVNGSVVFEWYTSRGYFSFETDGQHVTGQFSPDGLR